MEAMPLLEAREPWDQRQRESYKAYAAFLTYRDFPVHERTIRATAEHWNKSYELMRRWAVAYGWRDRAQAWDARVERERTARMVHEVRRMSERHASIAMELQRKAIAALQRLNPDTLRPRDVLSYLVEAVRIERVARGEPAQAIDDANTAQRLADEDALLAELADDPKWQETFVQLAAEAAARRPPPPDE